MSIDQTQSLGLRALDGGARYGLHETLVRLRPFLDVDLVEPDLEECARLRALYADAPNVRVHDALLWSEETHIELRQLDHGALTTAFSPAAQQVRDVGYNNDERTLRTRRVLETKTIDQLAGGNPYHYIKLDLEGAELHALLGASSSLPSCLAVRSEVQFREIIEGAPLFSDIDAYLRREGFQLLNLDYRGVGVAQSVLTPELPSGILVSTDGVWTRNPNEVARSGNVNDILRLAAILVSNHAVDVAWKLLTKSGMRLASADQIDPRLCGWLEAELLEAMWKVSRGPAVSMGDFAVDYRLLFERPLPNSNEMWDRIHRQRRFGNEGA